MYKRIIRNDLVKSWTVSLITLLFIASAATLISLAATLAVHLSGAIDTLMTQAKTPHFMQMHSGQLDTARLETFAQQNGNVDAFQVLEFLNVDGAQITIGGNTLAHSVQDNGFCTQSRSFDYLLDLDGNIIEPSDGELYVPLAYGKDGTAKLGDTAVIAGTKFTVAGFLRDSQMNSLLASSKRFLVSENDYAQIRNSGSIEYLIEFRLKDLSKLGAFETSYINANLEANGPTVTYPLFQMINAISDGLMIALLLLVSALVVVIAILCIRFTLLAKIEEDYREIGVLKAIGLRTADIKTLYLSKYGAIAVAGGALGYGLSLVFQGMALKNIRITFGESNNGPAAGFFGMASVLLVLFVIVAYVNGVLSRFRKISAAQAIRFGTAPEKSPGANWFHLSENQRLNTNVFFGIKDVLARKRLYAAMMAVVMVSAFIILVPQNLYHTISSPKFCTYMGIGDCDMLIDVQQTDDIDTKVEEITRMIQNDGDITQYAVLTTKRFTIMSEDGTEEQIKIELGNHTVFPVNYSKGKGPQTENEIALSAMNADELGKQIGDTIVLVNGDSKKKLTVCGIYSDITNGGKSAKAAFTEHGGDVMWYIICVKFSHHAFVSDKVAEYTQKFGFAKVADTSEYITQTFGPTIRSIGNVSTAGMMVALMITILVTLLTMKMLIAKDGYSIAVMKALGFTSRDIVTQYLSRFLLVLLVGIALGTVLANTLGEFLAGSVIASFGATSFQFVINPLSAYLLCPLAMGCAVLFAAILGASGVEKIKISEHIKE
jgi:putative ABC transport system permease protein